MPIGHSAHLSSGSPAPAESGPQVILLVLPSGGRQRLRLGNGMMIFAVKRRAQRRGRRRSGVLRAKSVTAWVSLFPLDAIKYAEHFICPLNHLPDDIALCERDVAKKTGCTPDHCYIT